MSKLAELLTAVAQRWEKSIALHITPSGGMAIAIDGYVFRSGEDEAELIAKLQDYLVKEKNDVENF